MQSPKTNFSKYAPPNTGSSHPKRENLQIDKQKRMPLTDKQYASQFMQSIMNISFLVADASTQEKFQQFPLANHLSGHSVTNDALGNQKPYFQTIQKKTQQNDVTTVTSQSFIDEESQYQNYLKEYQTLVKNSLSKVFVSPMAHKKEVDELITEFLSDMQESEIKTIEQSPKISKNKGKKKPENHEGQEIPRNPFPERVKTQKIDLRQLKANSNHHHKNDKKEENKKAKQSLKKKQLSRISRQPQIVVAFQTLSPRFTNGSKNQKKRFQQISTPRVKSRSKSHSKPKIEVINMEDLRKQRNQEKEKQLHLVAKAQYLQNKQTHHQQIQQQENPYMKKNLYKIDKTQQKKLLLQKPKPWLQQSLKKEVQNVAKKPIKIQIQLSSQSQEEENYLAPELEEQKQEIIKLISKKVANMIQDTKKIAINRGR